MSRVKTGFKRARKHKKILKATKGYKLTRSKLFKRANEAFVRAGEHAFTGRKNKKRDLRTLWITRINALLKKEGFSYKLFIARLKSKKVELNRKMLSEIATNHSSVFSKLIEKVK